MLRQIARYVVGLCVMLPIVHVAFFGLTLSLQRLDTPLTNVSLQDSPTWQMYRAHWYAILTGQLVFPGSNQPFTDELLERTGRTLGLFGLAAGLSSIAGIAYARRIVVRGRPAPWWIASADALQSLFVASMSIAGLYVIIVYTPWSAPFPLNGFGWDGHIILPFLALSLRPWLITTHHTVQLLEHERQAPHIMATRARGFSETHILNHHVFPAQQSAIGLILASQWRQIIADILVVEMLFGWGGIGETLVRAIVSPRLTNQAPHALYLDPGVVAGCAIVLLSLFVVIECLRLIWQPAYVWSRGQS